MTRLDLLKVNTMAAIDPSVLHRRDGMGDVGADLGPGPGLKHLTCWFGIRPEARGQVPRAVLAAFTRAFMRHLWDCGIRDLVALVVLRLAEGRHGVEGMERRGWRVERRRGSDLVLTKTLVSRP